MPRIKMGFEDPPRKTDGRLVDLLVDELKAGRDAGQPFIYEQAFSTGRVRILVVWDEWKDVPLEQRTATVLVAIEWSDGKEYRARVALASGVTVPEGTAAGMLPYQIIAARRREDKATEGQCREAMLAEGASQLFGPNVVQLRFPTEEAAEACRQRLINRVPNSDEIWLVSREVTAEDLGRLTETVAVGAE